MEYRDAVKVVEELTGGDFTISDVADALMFAYEKGKAEPQKNIDHISMNDVAEFCSITGKVLVSKETWQEYQTWNSAKERRKVNGTEAWPIEVVFYKGLLADRARMDYIRKHFSHQDLMADGFEVHMPKVGYGGLDEWLDVAIKEEAGK